MQNRLYLLTAAAVAMIAIIWLFSPILLPFAAGIVLAYLVDPLVTRLRAAGVPRWGGALLVVTSLVLAFLGTLALAVPYVVGLISGAIQAIPQRVQQLMPHLQPYIDRFHEHVDIQQIISYVTKSSERILSFALDVVKSTGIEALALFDLLALLFITPMVMFYLLRDWPQFIASCKKLLPRDLVKPAEQLLHKIDLALSGFLRGQTSVCFLLGLFYAIGLAAVGLNGGLLIGMLTGLFSFVPIIGMTVGVLIAAITAIFQYQWESGVTPYVLLTIVFVAGQILESFILTPRIVGNRVNLHPAWVVFALLAGGHLGGMLGVIVALPVAAILNVVIREAALRWKNSIAYSGKSKSKPTKKRKAKA